MEVSIINCFIFAGFFPPLLGCQNYHKVGIGHAHCPKGEGLLFRLFMCKVLSFAVVTVRLTF